jgi:hypothetical protein
MGIEVDLQVEKCRQFPVKARVIEIEIEYGTRPRIE